jgi:prolyl-tRNA synthetase
MCAACGYAANVELARSVAPMPVPTLCTADYTAPQEVATPDRRTIDEVSAFLGIGAHDLIKALVYVAGEQTVMVLVRGDHSLHENKLARFLKSDVRPAYPEEVEAATGAQVGFVGPVGVSLRVIADESLRPDDPAGARAYAAGANKEHTHLLGVVVGRDFSPEFADLREAEEEDACSQCGAPLRIRQMIEVGNIFKLGTKYSKPLGATVLDEAGNERPIIMGSYGIGPARIAAAAVEQSHDERGIVWPKAIAPFDVYLVQIQAKDDAQSRIAREIHDSLAAEGWEVLWDDREERPGFKFADAELVGCPIRVTVGKKAVDGLVEIQPRTRGEKEEISLEGLSSRVRRLWEAAS